MGNWPSTNYKAATAISGFGGKVVSNNWSEGGFGVTDAVMISGHRTVKAKEDLYSIPPQILSSNISNGGTDYSDAIGQVWYVQDENAKYKLTTWSNRKNAKGWEIINDIGETGNIIPGLGTGYLWENVIPTKNQTDYPYSDGTKLLNQIYAEDIGSIYFWDYSQSDDKAGKSKWSYSPILLDDIGIFTLAFVKPWMTSKKADYKLVIEVYFSNFPYHGPDKSRYILETTPKKVDGKDYTGTAKKYKINSMEDFFSDNFRWIFDRTDDSINYYTSEEKPTVNKVASCVISCPAGTTTISYTGDGEIFNIYGEDNIYINFKESKSDDKIFFFRIKWIVDDAIYAAGMKTQNLTGFRCYTGNPVNGAFYKRAKDYTSSTLEKCMQYRYDDLLHMIKELKSSTGGSTSDITTQINTLQESIKNLQTQLSTLDTSVIKKSTQTGNNASYLWAGTLDQFNRLDSKPSDTTFIITN